MLVSASWFEEFKESLGIQGVSQVWGDMPAWYFWISESPGAYLFQLEEAGEESDGGGSRGLFSIKYYPRPGTEVFGRFSFEERSLIESDLFDNTGTPLAEAREKIPESLFNVAAVECVLGSDDAASRFTMESLDLMCIRDETEVRRTSPGSNREEHFRPGEVGRSVPGWEIAYPLFDRLICLFAHYRKQKPTHIFMTRSPGFEYVYQGNKKLICRETDAVGVFALNILFPASGTTQITIGGGLPTGANDDTLCVVVFDHRSPCGHYHPPAARLPLVGSLNPQWWSLADIHFRSQLASTCGCDHDH